MTIPNLPDELVRFDEVRPETRLVAIARPEPEQLIEQFGLRFDRGYDDLDYLLFSAVALPSGKSIALVRHQNSPSPGTEICVTNEESDVISILKEISDFLSLSKLDFLWIHPDCTMSRELPTLLPSF